MLPERSKQENKPIGQVLTDLMERRRVVSITRFRRRRDRVTDQTMERIEQVIATVTSQARP